MAHKPQSCAARIPQAVRLSTAGSYHLTLTGANHNARLLSLAGVTDESGVITSISPPTWRSTMLRHGIEQRLPTILFFLSMLFAAVSSFEAAADTAETLTSIGDSSIELVQFDAAPRVPLFRNNENPQVARAASSAGSATAAATLASIPYMIGDTGAGTCLGFQGLIQADLSHPSLACARLNIAEANSPLPSNRLYYSYRHFHNASTISAYQFSEVLDLDRHLIAWETTFWDDMASVELRLPIEERIRSQIFSIITPDFGVVDPLVAPGDGRDTELGNIAGIFKYLLIEREWFALSAGLGVTLPTAQDVEYNLAVAGEIVFPSNPGLTADMNAAYQGVFATETIYLEPFLAWAMRPTDRWFHQGFLQVETAANPSRVTFNGVAATDFFQDNVFVGFYDFFTQTPQRVELFSQTLMRLNLGTGYFVVNRPQATGLRYLVALAELHYTTTLQDANLSDVPLTVNASGGVTPLQTITVGNGDNRVDILNAALGVSVNAGKWTVTNGFVAPVRKMPDRGFDFEYNLQVQRQF